jgi:hypothetical protein
MNKLLYNIVYHNVLAPIKTLSSENLCCKSEETMDWGFC